MEKFVVMLVVTILLGGCGGVTEDGGQITPQDAKARLDADEEIIILDVRTQEEFEAERIDGAVLLPVDEIREQAETVLPDKNATYYIYCRSGRRSATARQIMEDMGYARVYDLGGIIDWPYGTVREGDG